MVAVTDSETEAIDLQGVSVDDGGDGQCAAHLCTALMAASSSRASSKLCDSNVMKTTQYDVKDADDAERSSIDKQHATNLPHDELKLVLIHRPLCACAKAVKIIDKLEYSQEHQSSEAAADVIA